MCEGAADEEEHQKEVETQLLRMISVGHCLIKEAMVELAGAAEAEDML